MKKKTVEPEGEYIFQEQQRLRQWYVWITLLIVLSLAIAFTVNSVLNYLDSSPGAASFIVLGALLLSISLFFFISTAGSKLNVIATEDSLYFQWLPLNNRYNKVFWQNVQSVRMMEYKSLGYGMRISEKYGSIYNAFGGYAINIHTRGGNQFLIGTAKPKELEDVLVRMKDLHYFDYENDIIEKNDD